MKVNLEIKRSGSHTKKRRLTGFGNLVNGGLYDMKQNIETKL